MPISGVSRGIEFLAEGVGLETTPEGRRFSGQVPLYESAKQGLASIAQDPMGALRGAGEAVSGFLEEQMQASAIRPNEMVMGEDGQMRPATGEELSSALDPTLGGTFAAPIITRGAVGGLEGLMPEAGTLMAFGSPDPIKGKADVSARRKNKLGEGGPSVTMSTPFYSAADNWIFDNVSSEVSVDKLKKQINKDKDLTEMDRAILFDYIDNAQETKTFTNQQGREVTNTVVTPAALKETAEVRSIIPELEVRTFDPITPRQVQNRALNEDQADEILQTLETGTAADAVPLYESVLNQRFINSDNPSGKLEVGYITVSAPKETIEQASQAKLNKMKDARVDEIMPLKKRQDEILAQINESTASNQDRMQQFALNFPDEPIRDRLDVEPLVKEYEQLEEQIRGIMTPKDFDRDLEFPYVGSTAHRSLEGTSSSNLIFSRFVDQIAETPDGKSLSAVRLLDLQSDMLNDAREKRNVPDLIPGMTDPKSPAYRTLQKAAIKEAVLGAVEKGRNAVVLPHESSSGRPDLYRSGRMKSLAEQTVKDLGEGFRVEELKVRNQETMQEDWGVRKTNEASPEREAELQQLIQRQQELEQQARELYAQGRTDEGFELIEEHNRLAADFNSGGQYNDPPAEFTSQWSIVFDPAEVSGRLKKENVKFRTGGLVTLPSFGRDGIVDVIRKYRREGLMD